jgi:hypothetical protein
MGFTNFPSGQASPKFTTAVRTIYDQLQTLKVNNFGRSFYGEEMSPELYPAIEVRLGSEKLAKDVPLGHQGLRWDSPKFTQKAFELLNYNNYFDATRLEQYWRVFGSTSFNINEGLKMAERVAMEQKILVDAADRTLETQCMSIFEDGTITAADGTILNFGRKAASMVDPGVGFYWDNPATDVEGQIIAGCDFMRGIGKVQGYVMNMVLGSDTYQALRKNTALNAKWGQFHNEKDVLPPSTKDATGAIYQVTLDLGNYKVRVFTYADMYQSNEDNDNPTMVPYKDPKTAVILPVETNSMWKIFYGAVPMVQGDLNTPSLQVGKTIFADYINRELGYHKFYVKRRAIPVPVAVNQMYTIQALAV